MKDLDVSKLDSMWTADVKLNNNHVISIWWTAWYGMQSSIKEVISISSDYPRAKISDSK